MIFYRDRYTAIEYESSQKSKHRYRKIFNNYEFDRHVDQVLYIVGTPELAEKVSKEASLCSKLYFVSLGDIERDQVNTMLKSDSRMCSLRQLFETTQNISWKRVVKTPQSHPYIGEAWFSRSSLIPTLIFHSNRLRCIQLHLNKFFKGVTKHPQSATYIWGG